MCERCGMADTPTLSPLTHWRKARGWTLEEAAKAFGIGSKGYLCDIERRTRRCSVAIALKIEDVTEGVICASTLNPDVALVDKARAA